MEECSSHGSTSFFASQMLYELRFGVDNETDGFSSSVIKGEPLEYLNDVQITGADSNTETGRTTPMERELKRKRYGRRKSLEKLEKTDEKIADMKGTLQKKIDSLSGILKYIERELQEEIDENLYMTMRLKEKQKIKDEQIAEVKLLAKKLDRLRVETEEETGLTLSLHRQQLKPQSFTLQRATDPHIIGTNSDSVDKERRGTNFENVGKFSSMELAASHSISNGCANEPDILKKLEVDDESRVKFSDFADLGGERIPVGKYRFPRSLYQIVKNITEVYGDVSATSRMNLSIAEGIYIMFCASIKEMSNLQLEQVTEDLILKWRDAIKDALRINFKVEFAMEHLKKVARAYIGLMEHRKLLDNMASRISNLEKAQSIDEKAEHPEISETSKEYMYAAKEFIGKAVSSGMFRESPTKGVK